MHVATVNFVFPMFAGHDAPPSTNLSLDDVATAAPAYEGSLTSKDEVLEALRTSFQHLRTALEASVGTDLDREVIALGQPAPLRAVWVGHVVHIHEHTGQLIAYSRTNGVTPPWSR